MKTIIFILTFLLISVSSYAKSYLIVEDATEEIYSLSPEDDAVKPDGYTKHIIELEFTSIELQAHPTDYKYVNGNFILNIQKISDRENANIINQEKAEELRLITKKSKLLAIKELKREGKSFRHWGEEDFE